MLCEHAVVHDIGVRLLQLLGRERNIEVMSTLAISEGISPQNRGIPELPTKCTLTTTPPCDLNREHTRTAVNLRWMLANSIYRQVLEREGPSPLVTFVSIHVDARETGPGAAVFLPPSSPADPDIQSRRPYMRYIEGGQHFRLEPTEASGNHQRTSSVLARMLLRSLRGRGIDLDDSDPVRRFSADEGEVPAVLDYNRIPARVLIEIGNMRHLSDQKRLIDSDYRQRIAEAIAEALFEYRTWIGKRPGKAVADSLVTHAIGISN
jgi:hypothetical protein